MRLAVFLTTLFFLIATPVLAQKDKDEDKDEDKNKIQYTNASQMDISTADGSYSSMEEAMREPEKVIKLTLTDTDLKELSPEIGKLVNLQVLNLNNNKLRELPQEIGDLQNLRTLSLYKNKLRVLPVSFRKLQNLETLYLGKNKLKEVPVWMGGFHSLRRIDLSFNQITPNEINTLRVRLPKAEITF